MTVIQDFPLPANNDMDVTFTIDPTDNISLVGATVEWRAWASAFGVPSGDPLITKASNE